MDYNILQKEAGDKGTFYMEADGKVIGEVIYTLKDKDVLSLDHTEVAPEMAGQGLASKLVKHTVDYARENQLKVKPMCEYAAKQFDRHKEYQEIQVKS